MKPFLIVLAAVVAGTCVNSSASSSQEREKTDPSGVWKVARSAGNDPLAGFILTLAWDDKGGKLSGYINWPDGKKSEIMAGAFKDGMVSFKVAPASVIQSYSGKFEGATIKGHWAASIATFEWEARRAEPSQAEIGKPLEFVGVSGKRSFEEALADALQKMDKAVSQRAKVPCAKVAWKVVDVSGVSGTPAGLNVLEVKISASFATRDEEPKDQN